ncbi:failed axon connections homolog [Ruditapes philippinarum]|uniref:failed axon connections homolog n=1 Tax=Ruditapes philippinarum TaxID=129788 RepID=UPI00295A9D07|nr:failed axon connections homolog [Ruditapes philippinarum]
MENIKLFCTTNWINITAGLAISVTTIIILRKIRNRPKKRVCGIDYPADTVILHQFERGKTAPSVGHFVMKLETFLRVNKITYQSDFNFRNGPKGKVPWIEYNGTTMGDSHMIIEMLNKEFKIDMDSHLSEYEKAVAWAIQKWIEEYMYWLNVHTRWVILTSEMFEEGLANFSSALKPLIRRKALDMTFKVGIGRHSNSEVHDLMVNDLRKFSQLLGNKNYIMGDKMAVVDCAAFGILSQIRWCTPSKCPGTKLLHSGELSNVVSYMDRIKNTYWPDWESLTADK